MARQNPLARGDHGLRERPAAALGRIPRGRRL